MRRYPPGSLSYICNIDYSISWLPTSAGGMSASEGLRRDIRTPTFQKMLNLLHPPPHRTFFRNHSTSMYSFLFSAIPVISSIVNPVALEIVLKSIPSAIIFCAISIVFFLTDTLHAYTIWL